MMHRLKICAAWLAQFNRQWEALMDAAA